MEILLAIGLVIITITFLIAVIACAVDSSREKEQRRQQQETVKAMQERLVLDGEMLDVMKAIIREANHHIDAQAKHPAGKR